MTLPHGTGRRRLREGEHRRTETAQDRQYTRLHVRIPCFPQKLTQYAADLAERDDDYAECWTDLAKKFDPTSAPVR